MGLLHNGKIPFMNQAATSAPFDAEERAMADAFFPHLERRDQTKIRTMLTVPWDDLSKGLPGAERVKFVITLTWFDGWRVLRNSHVINWLNDSSFWNDHAAKLLMAVFCPSSTGDTQQALESLNKNLKRLSKKIKNGDKHWSVRLEDLSTCQVWEWAYGKKFRPIEMK